MGKMGKKQVLCILLGIILAAAGYLVEKRDGALEDGNRLNRYAYGEGERQQEVWVRGLCEKEIPVEISLGEREYAEEDAKKALLEAGGKLADLIRGNNLSLQEVREDLHLVGWLEEEGIRGRRAPGGLNKRAICMSKSVQSNSAVLVHFTLKLDDGSTAESTRSNGKPALFRLGDTSLSEGLEQQLLGLKEGEKKAFSLEPDAAFGVPSPDLIQYFSRREFIDAGEPEIGAIMLFTAMDGSEMPGVIREVNGDSITVDFNHPLAGRTVHFDIEVLEIDPALEE